MPAALTIHDIDDELYAAIRAKADEMGTSMNRAIKATLASALGLFSSKRTKRDRDLAPFFGGLDDSAWKRAKLSLAESRTIESEDWA